ncbi:MAG: right-handed parallel beta-helix repeat-containing protein [Candidatus Coatesbacteria bacterium]
MNLRFAVSACLLIASTAHAAPVADATARAVVTGTTLPLITDGATVKAGDKKQEALEIPFNLPTRGVWYLWLRVTAKSGSNSVLTYALDGKGYRSARGRITVQPSAKSQWLSHSDYREFNAEVHADAPGEHVLRIRAEYGEVSIEKVALTLYFSAKPAGDTLDHAGDPGEGQAVFPDAPKRVDGFRPDWVSPPVKAERTYYVDAAAGDDARDGLTAATAWKSFRNVNGRAFQPGDAILLKRGSTWEEGLSPGGSGTPEKVITIGAYGDGPRPVIDGINRDAVHLEEQSYWTIQDLELTTDPAHHRCGLRVETTAGHPQPKGIRVYNVIAYDNGPSGISVGSSHGEGNGYDGVVIENCLAYANDSDGIVTSGSDQNGCRNTVIRYCTAYSNLYAAGIWITSGENGLIEHCLAYNNACINIWAWNAINITMRHCEAFRGRTPRDAGGFDIDWSVEASTLEYCYSHHNEGVGILLMGGGTGTYRKFPMASRYNLARYNISENDNPGIGMVETFEDGKVVHNLAIASGAGRDGKPRTAIDISGWPVQPDWGSEERHGGWPARTEYFDNIFIGRHGALPAAVDDWAATRKHANVFDANLYWRDTPGALIRWDGRRNGNGFWMGTESTDLKPAEEFASLEAFRKKTGHERHGLNADPGFANPYRGEYGRLPMDSYRLAAGSPAAKAGRPVTLSKAWLKGRAKYLTNTGAEAYGIPMAPAEAVEDFWGEPLTPGSSPAIGPSGR